MKQLKQLGAAKIIGLLILLAKTNAEPTCQRVSSTEVTCTAGDTNVILQRGLVSDNNKTTKITLRGCRITKLDFEAFENDDNLLYIDLSVNKLQKLDLGVLDGNHLVTHLNLSDNLLTSFPLGLFDEKPNIEVLDFNTNMINSLELGIFDRLEKLVYIDLSRNSLLGKDINAYIFDKSTKIKHVDFSFNKMNESPDNLLHAFTALEVLNLEKCGLPEIPSFAVKSNMVTMKHLNLLTNLISKIEESQIFRNLVSLEILNLAENLIEELAADVFKPLTKLRVITLRNNKLKKIHHSLFLNLKLLQNVDLSVNLIEYVPVNAFRGTSIKNLNLSYNRFSYLDANFCLELRNSGVNLNKFYFNDNPWQCACLNDILKEVKANNVKYNNAKYNGVNSVCLTTNSFTCKRQVGDNDLFIEMYDRQKQGK